VAEELVEYTPAPGNLSSNARKIVNSSLTNIAKIAAELQLPADRVREKQAAIYEEYGLSLLHTRDLAAARDCFRQALARRPHFKALVHWMATFAPSSVLNLRRRWRQWLLGGAT
jgi:hypothetical protein